VVEGGKPNSTYAEPVAEPGEVRAGVSDRVLTLPNVLSMVRLLLVPVFFWLILLGRDGWAIVVLVASGITDYLDGFLARRWGQLSRLGQLLDPLADRLYILSTLLGLAWREVVPWWLVAALVARDVVLAGTIPMLARLGYGPLPVHHIGKAATFNLLYAFPILLLAEASQTAAVVARPVGWAFAWWGLVLYWWAGAIYLRQVARLRREERDRQPSVRRGIAGSTGGAG
jgi:cardiolipin synthase